MKKIGQLQKTSRKKIKPLEVVSCNRRLSVVDEKGEKHSLRSEKVEVILPSMGELSTVAFSAIMKAHGYNAMAIPVATMETLKYGRKVSNCKECLPFILTTGSMIEYLREKKSDKITLFFMPKGGGPCRQGQYHVRMRDIIANYGFENTGILSLDDENSYGEIGMKFILSAWKSIIISDLFEDIRNALYVLAVNRKEALKIFNEEWDKIIFAVSNLSDRKFYDQLISSAGCLARIDLKRPLSEAKVVSLIGEVYVRRDQFSRLDLIERLAEKEFVVRIAPVSEYIYYCNYLAKKNSRGVRISLRSKLKIHISDHIQLYIEKKIKGIMAESRLIHYETTDIEEIIDHSRHLINDNLMGESILTVGSALREIIDHSCGIISIGPFACMPSRFAASILDGEMNIQGKAESDKDFIIDQYRNFFDLPFLSIETDGNLFPLIIQSKIDIFMLQAERLFQGIKKQKQTLKK